MRGTAATMTVLRPKTPREAIRAYAATPEALPIVGGTDLMVLWNLGELNDRVMLDLSRLNDVEMPDEQDRLALPPCHECARRDFSSDRSAHQQ